MDKTSARIRVVREKTGLPQAEFAKAIGIPFRTYYRYESGEREPSTTALINIAHLGNINLNWILTGKGNMFFEDSDSSGENTPFNKDESVQVEDNNLVDIAYYPDTYASAGYGATNHDAPPAVMRFDPDFLSAQLGIRSFKHLHIITARGDSMEPDIHDGGLLFVLPVENEPSLISGSVYVVNCDGEVYVKRLEKFPFSKEVKLHSDNKEYQPISVGKEDLDKCHFIGRVVGHFSRV